MPNESTLDEIAVDPARAADLPASVRQRLTLRCAAVLAALAAAPTEEAAGGNARLIDLEEAARALGISPATLRKKQVPFRVKIGGAVRYSLAGIER